jgi:hypothetical protein
VIRLNLVSCTSDPSWFAEMARGPVDRSLALVQSKGKDENRLGDLGIFKALERYRRAGEHVAAAKGRSSHGGLKRFLEDHCPMCGENSNTEMRVFPRWDKVGAKSEQIRNRLRI